MFKCLVLGVVRNSSTFLNETFSFVDGLLNHYFIKKNHTRVRTSLAGSTAHATVVKLLLLPWAMEPVR